MNTKNMKGLLGVALLLVTSQTFASVGDYREIDCNADYFTANNCSACFEGKAVAVGDQINGLYDTWTNKNANEQIIYKDEQSMPEIVPVIAGTVFLANPLDPVAYWKYGNQVIWTDSATGTGKQEFMLDAGKSIKFLEADLGASYTMTANNAPNGSVVGVVKFPLSYHNVDADGNEGKKETHIECVSYTTKPTTVTVAPVEVVKPEPKKLTTVKTGPEESLALFAIALLIAAGVVVVRNRKSV
ncbi:MAG: hypothetical protein PHH70_04180 [Candidatus Gracilibacteria bacterium]|nr:hypothetical protein [Candidatus Gracilibacteria bacterium]